MSIIKRNAITLLLLSAFLTLTAQSSSAQERLCDPAFEDCRTPLWQLIDNETVGIDVAFWFMQDSSFSNKIIARHNAGVPVRVLVDPRANPVYAGNEQILNQLAAAGIPMRKNVAGGILHWKMMLFAGQNTVQFSGANYSAHFFVPTQPYTNYIDEAIYFTSNPSVVNSFRTKYDDLWTNTVQYTNYANISGALTRRYSVFPIDPEMNFPPRSGGEEFANRTVSALNAETRQIDVIMYRITDRRPIDALIAAKNRGVQVRLLTEPQEYRNPDKFWHSWNVDRLYMAGVEIRQRKTTRLGLNHEKAVILYGQGVTIFGSSNWTTSSSNSQEEHNYFTAKPWFSEWFISHFERKWNSTTENEPFVPLPPGAPVNRFPAPNATGQLTTMTLKWEGGLYAHKYDVYFGTQPDPPLVKTDHTVFQDSVYPGNDETFVLPTLQPGTTYYWRIVSKTMANMGTSGPVWSFTTAGTATPAPPPTVSGITPNSGTTSGGTSVTITGTGFRSGASVSFGGAAATSISVTSATSISAVTPARAAGTVSVVVTNSDGQSASLSSAYTYTSSSPPPSPGDIVLYASEAPVKVGSWSVAADSTAAGGARLWNPDAGAPKLAAPLASPAHYFEMTFNAEAGRAYHLWIRGKAQTDYWGNDSVFIQFSDSVTNTGTPIYRIGTTSATDINLEDCSGCNLSGWGWQDNGWGVGVMGPNLFFQSTGTHTIRVQTREDGLSIDQIVLSPGNYLNSSPGALKNDTTILPKTGAAPSPSPTVSAITPGSGPTAGGTPVTISGSGFAAGASVSFGGVAATNINVTSSTSISATTPARAAGTVSVVVTNSNGQSGTLPNAYTYTSTTTNPAPTLSAVTPNSGTTSGGTSVTITGTGFRSGASVSFGGAAATSISVTSATSISAVTPARAAGTVSVVVTNSDGQSASLSSAYTYIGAPATPSGLSATAISSSRIDLSWVDNASNEQGFKIERSTDGLIFTEVASVGLNIRAYSDTGLRSNRRYHYRVRAFNSAGNSAYSNTASARTH